MCVGAPVPPREREFARALRRRATAAERTAWQLVRNRRLLGLKFRRQQVIEGFVVDLYCAELRLAIEIDGAIHARPLRAAYDRDRERWLERAGIRVVRIANHEVSEAGLVSRLRPLLTRAPLLGGSEIHEGVAGEAPR